jgi:hypothetical protein
MMRDGESSCCCVGVACGDEEVVWGDDLADSGRDGRLQPPIGNVGERLLEAGVGAAQRPLEDETEVGVGVSGGPLC